MHHEEDDVIEDFFRVQTDILNKDDAPDIEKLHGILEDVMSIMEFSIKAQERSVRYLDDMTQQIKVAMEEGKE